MLLPLHRKSPSSRGRARSPSGKCTTARWLRWRNVSQERGTSPLTLFVATIWPRLRRWMEEHARRWPKREKRVTLDSSKASFECHDSTSLRSVPFQRRPCQAKSDSGSASVKAPVRLGGASSAMSELDLSKIEMGSELLAPRPLQTLPQHVFWSLDRFAEARPVLQPKEQVQHVRLSFRAAAEVNTPRAGRTSSGNRALPFAPRSPPLYELIYFRSPVLQESRLTGLCLSLS